MNAKNPADEKIQVCPICCHLVGVACICTEPLTPSAPVEERWAWSDFEKQWTAASGKTFRPKQQAKYFYEAGHRSRDAEVQELREALEFYANTDNPLQYPGRARDALARRGGK